MTTAKKNKITFISSVTSPERAYANIPELDGYDVKFFTILDEPSEIIKNACDTEFLIVDAMGKVDAQVIDAMPDLRLIQSEGVGYQGIDVATATKRGIPVCNNKGINDTAVAESAVFLILACLKNYNEGLKAVYDGRQIEKKAESFGVVRELSECTVGLVGFGDIARQTARLLNAFGARVVYYNRTRYTELEDELRAEYVSLDELLDISDFVSLHLAVSDETREIVNADFIAKMKNTAYLINTARGDLVDNSALYDALKNGKIKGAGLDVIAPEPVTADNILLDEAIKDKLIITPHIAGITALTVKKLYRNCYDNIQRVLNNEQPNNRIN
ncbi:2-hydroxyacid dehydrogenase [Eubacterium sp.]|uniref:2-hydroxyacid dehydrogenase n=1 Tax=Eubacterium sp. TaxID=142586 RepID=UPI003F0D7833